MGSANIDQDEEEGARVVGPPPTATDEIKCHTNGSLDSFFFLHTAAATKRKALRVRMREREVQKRKSFHPWGDVLWYTVAGLWERGR